MRPQIGKRSIYNKTKEKKVSKASAFIIRNTKKSVTLKQEYLYVEDVKTAVNIHHLEQNILLKRWMIYQLSRNISHQKLIESLEKSMEKDRHLLQKRYKISL